MCVYDYQVALGWFFGDSEPNDPPKPILVSGHMTHSYRMFNFKRAEVDAAPIQVTLRQPEDAVVQQSPRFGSEKCKDGSAPGRWVNLLGRDCEPPFCSGDRRDSVNFMDWVGHCGVWFYCLQSHPSVILVVSLIVARCCGCSGREQEAELGLGPPRMLLPHVHAGQHLPVRAEDGH
jgi:hypothetical protein